MIEIQKIWINWFSWSRKLFFQDSTCCWFNLSWNWKQIEWIYSLSI